MWEEKKDPEVIETMKGIKGNFKKQIIFSEK